MNFRQFPDRELFRVSGRALIWVEVADVQFVPTSLNQSIPLFLDDDADGGRFLCEMDGYISIPVNTAYKVHETGEPYTALFFPERITPTE